MVILSILLQKNKNSEPGFTLIEIVVVIFVFSVLAAGIIVLVSSILTNSQKQETQLYNASQARRLSFDVMEEIRRATDSDVGAYPVSSAGAHQLIIYTNSDDEGDVERVRYFIQNGMLMKGVIKPVGSPPVYNVANEQVAIIQRDVANQAGDHLFYYYGDAYAGNVADFLPQPVNVTDVRYIRMNLMIYNKGGITDQQTYTVTAGGALRNLKTNLAD